jgi:D-alanyl-D-alanine carboxypeptidase
MDLGFYQDGVLRTFLGVGRTAWFAQNSYNFGFILRYPYNSSHITQVAYEPWHFRYVGLPHAYLIHQKGMVFEEYIDFIMEHNYEMPFVAIFGDYEYEIFFTGDMVIKIPYDSYFDISGNNIDGFIVTVRR